MMRVYEYRLRPNQEQERRLLNALSLTRELYNNCLAELIEYYKNTGQHMGLYSQDKLHGKKQHPKIPAVLVDTTIRKLHGSFANFFRSLKTDRRVGFPRFKCSTRWHSLQFRDAVSNGVDGCYFKAGVILGGKIRFNKHREIEGRIKFCRIISRPSGWYLQAICEDETALLRANKKVIGLDFGITNLVVDSQGNIVANPQSLKRNLKKLGKAQRSAARRKKGSERRKKAARRIARIHERICNQRKDYLHKVAKRYVDNYGVIVIEDLKPANMVRTRFLARAISDSSWGILRGLIESKAEKAGRIVLVVPPHYTSQKCSGCGAIVKKSLSERTHHCSGCGLTTCRDLNAAINIKRAGLALRGEAA